MVGDVFGGLSATERRHPQRSAGLVRALSPIRLIATGSIGRGQGQAMVGATGAPWCALTCPLLAAAAHTKRALALSGATSAGDAPTTGGGALWPRGSPRRSWGYSVPPGRAKVTVSAASSTASTCQPTRCQPYQP